MDDYTQIPIEVLGPMRQVADAVTYLQKDRYNESQKFNYTSESMVKREFHRQFLRAGLLFTCTEEACETKPHTNREGNQVGYLTTITLEIRLTHLESGKTAYFTASGQGFDMQDKSVGKAYSYAIKTWLLNNFLVETGEDVERDDDNEKLDKEPIEKAFEVIVKRLQKIEPKKGLAKEHLAKAMAGAKTHSGAPVGHPSEFKSAYEARGAYRYLEILEDQWKQDQFARDAKSGKSQPGTGGETDATSEPGPASPSTSTNGPGKGGV